MSFNRSVCRSGYLIAFMALLMASSALVTQAEIYKCRGASGQASFSEHPCPVASIVGNSEAHKLWRDMRVLVNEGQSLYKKLGPDVSSIIACNKAAKVYGLKLDVVDNRLQSVDKNKNFALFDAQQHLRQCGQCRASAVHYCKQASQALDKQMNALLPVE